MNDLQTAAFITSITSIAASLQAIHRLMEEGRVAAPVVVQGSPLPVIPTAVEVPTASTELSTPTPEPVVEAPKAKGRKKVAPIVTEEGMTEHRLSTKGVPSGKRGEVAPALDIEDTSYESSDSHHRSVNNPSEEWPNDTADEVVELEDFEPEAEAEPVQEIVHQITMEEVEMYCIKLARNDMLGRKGVKKEEIQSVIRQYAPRLREIHHSDLPDLYTQLKNLEAASNGK